MFGYGGPVATMCLGRYKLRELFIYTHKSFSIIVFFLFLFFASLIFFLKLYCRRAVVSSKTKGSNKVFTLHMEREALVNASHTENCWKVIDYCTSPLCQVFLFSLITYYDKLSRVSRRPKEALEILWKMKSKRVDMEASQK